MNYARRRPSAIFRLSRTALKSNDPAGLPSFTDYRGPLLNWFKRCQSGAFAIEIQSLRLKCPVKKRSSLVKLAPIIGDDVLLKVGGRVGAATVPFDNLHPVILPIKHPLTDKILQAFKFASRRG